MELGAEPKIICLHKNKGVRGVRVREGDVHIPLFVVVFVYYIIIIPNEPYSKLYARADAGRSNATVRRVSTRAE